MVPNQQNETPMPDKKPMRALYGALASLKRAALLKRL